MTYDESGDDLVATLASAFDDDPSAPADLIAFAKAAFQWRAVDVELAELVFDSATSDLAGIRSTATDRRAFRFVAFDNTLRVFFANDSMIVTVEPPVAATCRVASYDASTDYRMDDDGELIVAAPELPMRIEIDLPEGVVVTPWIIG